jgi:hypothetical protein
MCVRGMSKKKESKKEGKEGGAVKVSEEVERSKARADVEAVVAALSEVHHALKAVLEEGGTLDSVTDPDTQRVVNAVRGTRFYELHREAETKHLEQERERIEEQQEYFG